MAVASFELLRFAQSLFHTKCVSQNFIGDQILKICLFVASVKEKSTKTTLNQVCITIQLIKAC